MHQPDKIRSRIIKLLIDLRAHVSLLDPLERDLLLILEGPKAFDNMTEIANEIMVKLGHRATAPKEPRFDKTRRRLNKMAPKPLKGEKGKRTKAELAEERARG